MRKERREDCRKQSIGEQSSDNTEIRRVAVRERIMRTYEEVCEYIAGIPRFAAMTELANTGGYLELLNHPEREYRCVHIAGTNGKGSVSKMISLMLEEKGLKTGLFISPHFLKLNERISINGEDISDEDFVKYFEEVYALAKKAEDGGLIHPSYFEFLFLMAAKYFAGKKCDYVVWETGLGGRLDATNTVLPEVSVITSIGLDHMQYLGNTVEEIAAEKAGIIKNGVPVIYNTGHASADEVINKRAGECGCAMYDAGKLSRYLLAQSDEDYRADTDLEKELFGAGESPADILREFGEKTTASYQTENAATAAVAFTVLNGKSEETLSVIERALDRFYWPGRMEYLLPNLIVDGAHNEDAVKRFVPALLRILDKEKKEPVLIFAVSEDKDYRTMISMLCEGLPLKEVYVTELSSSRKTDAGKVAELFRENLTGDGEVSVYHGSEDIVKAVKENTDGDKIFAAMGSLYLVGEIRKCLGDGA